MTLSEALTAKQRTPLERDIDLARMQCWYAKTPEERMAWDRVYRELVDSYTKPQETTVRISM